MPNLQRFLEKHRLQRGSFVEVLCGDEQSFAGQIVPSYPEIASEHLTLEMADGYRFGLRLEDIQSIREKGYRSLEESVPETLQKEEGPISHDLLVFLYAETASQMKELSAYFASPSLRQGPEQGCLIKEMGIHPSVDEGPSHWKALAESIASELIPVSSPPQLSLSFARREAPPEPSLPPYRGILVVHPYENLIPMATALSFMVQELAVPVLFCPIHPPESFHILRSAPLLKKSVSLARRASFAEVAVVVPQKGAELPIMALRPSLLSSLPRYASPSLESYDLAQEPVLSRDLSKPVRHRQPQGQVKLQTGFSSKIAFLPILPGLPVEYYESQVTGNTKAILFVTSGRGDLPSALQLFLKKRSEEEIMLFTSCDPEYNAPVSTFIRGRKLSALGVNSLPPIQPMTAYIKLGWAMGQASQPERVASLMQMNLIGECVF